MTLTMYPSDMAATLYSRVGRHQLLAEHDVDAGGVELVDPLLDEVDARCGDLGPGAPCGICHRGEDLRSLVRRPRPRGIGLSDEELAAAKRIEEPSLTAEELRPVITVTLPTLLVAELPILVDLAARFGLWTEGEDREPGEPAMLTHAEATKIADSLGCRLPSEAEWETMCRSGASTLFP